MKCGRLVGLLVMLGCAAVAVGQVREVQRGRLRATTGGVGAAFGDAVASHLDIPYAGDDNPRHRLDLYLPKERTAGEKLPVIMFVHGGGWRAGNKAMAAGRLAGIVRAGKYAAVSVGYRLTDEAQWPAQIHDCKAALRWVRANAGKYGLDPEKIGVWGTSAGGHLVLMLGAAGDVAELEGDLGPYKGVSSRVACVANYFGVTDFGAVLGQPSSIDHRGPNAPEARLLGGPIGEKAEKAREASPVTWVTADDPPVLTVHGTADRVVPYDQAVRIDAALKKAGVASYFVTVKGAGHGDFGRAADDRLAAFFEKYLRGGDGEVRTEAIEFRGAATRAAASTQ